ncbi:MAG: L-2-hydroxyglutarate oxidase [Solirubrobacterales bacterium]|nr:L-2-hydroxyglutarate oxidase [Solirubrobacterales bacterium]
MQGPFDLVVVGGGIVGLAAAREAALRRPEWRICVLEKEDDLATHQTGHNSGVIHAGVYYEAGSLKARLCRDGRRRLEEFCRGRGVPFRRVGKLIVATEPEELPRLDALEQRARDNRVPGLERLGPAGIKEIEPHAAGLAALHSPETGVVDFAAVARALAAELAERGHAIATGHEVTGIEPAGDRSEVRHSHGVTIADRVLCCAGAWSDRLAVGSGASPDPRILPFRGAYLEVSEEKRDLVKGMIYPVPDPALPFLGVHLTRHLDGSLSVGPTALLVATAQPAQPLRGRVRDLLRVASWPGTRRMAWRNRAAARQELTHALHRGRLIEAARRFVPELDRSDLRPGMSGIRAQAVGRDGALADDFAFSQVGHVLHVRNAPSPAATSSPAIGSHLAERLDEI